MLLFISLFNLKPLLLLHVRNPPFSVKRQKRKVCMAYPPQSKKIGTYGLYWCFSVISKLEKKNETFLALDAY